MAFQEATKAATKGKPDARGQVVVRVMLQDPRNKTAVVHLSGNLRDDIFVEGATVSEVAAAVRAALFAHADDDK